MRVPDQRVAADAHVVRLRESDLRVGAGEREHALRRLRRQPTRRGRTARGRNPAWLADRRRDDLVEAIKRLRQGIQNLNREARERLLASFEVVNTHFKHLFTELFGGGTAELQLIEHEDPLEAGLEIIARPPGKKPATLSPSPAESRRSPRSR